MELTLINFIKLAKKPKVLKCHEQKTCPIPNIIFDGLDFAIGLICLSRLKGDPNSGDYPYNQ